MQDLLCAMKQERLSVSFEVVTRTLGHHGQLPQGEYLVVTSISRITPDAQVEVRATVALLLCSVNDNSLLAR